MICLDFENDKINKIDDVGLDALKELAYKKSGTIDWEKFDQLSERGNNSKTLIQAISVMRQPPINADDIEQVNDRLMWYLQHCAENNIKPTVAGLSNSMGLTRTMLLKRVNQPEVDADVLLQKALGLLEDMWETYMLNDEIPAGVGVYLGKNNFGYSDKQEFEVKQQTLDKPMDRQQLVDKYLEVIVDEPIDITETKG